MKRQILIVTLLCNSFLALPQVVYQDLTSSGIYDFMDELANLKIIDLTSVVKPYARVVIAEKLKEAMAVKEKLNKRQKKELEFYLRDFNLELKPDLSWLKKDKGLFHKNNHLGIPLNPLSLQYKDSLFTFSLRPIYGISGSITHQNSDPVYHRWGGAEVFGYIGPHVGFYMSLRDHHESQLMVNREYLTTDEGAAWKNASTGGDYSEMRGGVSFAWNWGSVILAKDHFEWGDNYHGSNLLSGRTPSFPFLQLRMNPARWFAFNFVTAQLVSEVVDSSRTYMVSNGPRDYYFNKFLSAALLTFSPFKNLDLSVGNSVVSCSKNYNPAYLSPFLFYTHPAATGDSAQKASYGKNTQFFINLSSRQIRHFHLYASLFIDDLGTTRFNDTTYTSISWKAGFRVSNIFNLSFTAEYTRTSPKTYSYPESTLTFESNRYCLGNYLRGNSQEIYASLGYRPFRGLVFNASYNLAQQGGNSDTKTLNTVNWTYEEWNLNVNYEFINNAYVMIGYQDLNITGDASLSPSVFFGHHQFLSGGVNIGF